MKASSRSAASSLSITLAQNLVLWTRLKFEPVGDALSTQSTSEPDVVNGIRELSEFIAASRAGRVSRGEEATRRRGARRGAGRGVVQPKRAEESAVGDENRLGLLQERRAGRSVRWKRGQEERWSMARR